MTEGSKHFPGNPACECDVCFDPSELPDPFDDEAEAAGLRTCKHCGFDVELLDGLDWFYSSVIVADSKMYPYYLKYCTDAQDTQAEPGSLSDSS